jgi:hypothetical protein
VNGRRADVSIVRLLAVERDSLRFRLIWKEQVKMLNIKAEGKYWEVWKTSRGR